MEKRFLLGRVNISEEECGDFIIEYYILEFNELYSIEIVKEAINNYGIEETAEIATSFPISRTRKVVERILTIFMRNSVTPISLFECLDDLYEI